MKLSIELSGYKVLRFALRRSRAILSVEDSNLFNWLSIADPARLM